MTAVVDLVGKGLHYNEVFLRLWRQRIKDSKYVKLGDVQANSPGDWNRIVANAKKHLSSPATDKYSNAVYKGTGCVPNLSQSGYVSTHNPTYQGTALRDAGFYYLITGETKYADSVRTVLLAEASNSWLNFSNTSRWCPGGLNDLNPGFIIAEWLTRMLYGYDYIKGTLSTTEKAKLNAWFLAAARYMQSNVDRYINGLFVNSPGGNYTLSPAALSREKEPGSLMYYGGPKARYSSRHYSNRRAAIAAYCGLAGIFLGDQNLTNFGIRFFKEMIMFGIYPSGYYVDFLRGVNSSNPEKGYAYSTNGAFIGFAVTLAMSGNTELLDFETILGTTAATSGVDASSNGTTKKGLKMHIKAMLDLRNHQKAAYATSYSTNNGKEYYRIDGITPGGGYSVRDTIYALPNLYYKDDFIKASYTRKAAGAIPYPSSPQPDGDASPWTLGCFPGVLFMFGQLEGEVTIGAGTPVPDPDPIPDPVPTGPQIVSFSLINAETNAPIQTIANGAIFDLASLPTRKLNIRANTDPAKIGSVGFVLSGMQSRTVVESAAPYALFGDVNGVYNDWTPSAGAYALKATAFPSAGGAGTPGNTLIINFTFK